MVVKWEKWGGTHRGWKYAVGHLTGDPEEKKEQTLGTPTGKNSPGRREWLQRSILKWELPVWLMPFKCQGGRERDMEVRLEGCRRPQEEEVHQLSRTAKQITPQLGGLKQQCRLVSFPHFCEWGIWEWLCPAVLTLSPSWGSVRGQLGLRHPSTWWGEDPLLRWFGTQLASWCWLLPGTFGSSPCGLSMSCLWICMVLASLGERDVRDWGRSAVPICPEL